MDVKMFSKKNNKGFSPARARVPGRVSSIMSGGYSRYRKSVKNRKFADRSGVSSVYKLPFGIASVDKKVVRNAITAIASAVGFVAVIAAFILMMFLKDISEQMPTPESLRTMDFAEASNIYDRNGTLLYTTYGNENREYITLDKVPEKVRWAVVAAEDMEFYEHSGVDVPGLAMVFVDRVRYGEWGRGSSTITQQLVRNTVLVDLLGEKAFERSEMRKLKEIIITLKFEQELSKDEILEYYLNIVPLGGTVYGFQSGAQTYFGKNVSELTLAESAMLAGIIQAPGYYSPLFGLEPDLAEVRKEYVLDQMEKNLGRIPNLTQEDIDNARNEKLVYKQAVMDIKAPHFALWVKQLLIEEFGEDMVLTGGLEVKTTLDYAMQQVASDEIKKVIDGSDEAASARTQFNVNNGSLVAIDPRTGEILAMVGSYDYWKVDDPRVDGNVNVALTGRQMGSSAKPIAYLTALSQGYYPSLITPDIDMKFGTYRPTDWDKSPDGHMFMRDALLMSRNIPAIYTNELAGVDNYISSAERLGITTLTDRASYGLSIAIGAADMKLLEVTSAYGVFAAEGIKHTPTPFIEVKDKHGNILKQLDSSKADRVFSEQDVYMLNWILCNESNAPRLAAWYYTAGGQKLCGKTGTTDGPRDLTSFLYYPNLVVGVWTGNNNNEVTCGRRYANGDCAGSQGWSTDVPLRINHSFFSNVVGYFDKAWYTRPGGIVSSKICRDSGLPADDTSNCGMTESIFFANTMPAKDSGHEKIAICKVNGLVATNADAARRMGLVTDVSVIDLQLANKNHEDEWHSWLVNNRGVIAGFNNIAVDQVVYKFELPAEAECPLGLGANNEPVVVVNSPAVGSKVLEGSSVNVSYSAISLDPITEVRVTMDGANVSGGYVTGNPGSLGIVIPLGLSEGNHQLTVTVTDSSGRVGQATVQIFFVPLSDVSISITTPTSGQTIGGVYVVNMLTGGGDVANVLTVRLYVLSGTTEVMALDAVKETAGNNWRASIDTSVLSDGPYTLYAVASTELETFQSSSVNVIKD